jgi:hypothetical protein
MTWHRKHLLDIESLSPEEIITVLDTARAFKAVGERAIKKVPALRGKTVSTSSSNPPPAPGPALSSPSNVSRLTSSTSPPMPLRSRKARRSRTPPVISKP